MTSLHHQKRSNALITFIIIASFITLAALLFHHHVTIHTTNDIPGNGWSNGDLPPSMFPVTRQGRIELYGNNRRWINLHKGWTRIGSGHQHDFRHSTSGVGDAHDHDSPEEEAATVRSLIAQLCETFYQRGWATV